MILLDRVPLDHESLNHKEAKHHDFAKEYNETMTYLHEHFPKGVIHFKRKGAQKYTKGTDNLGREVPKMAEPIVPWRIPLRGSMATGNKGTHEWACCLSAPEPLANGLWDMGRTKAITIKGSRAVDIKKEPDLAFFLFKVSRFVHKGLIAVADPKADDEAIGKEEKLISDRKYAVWNALPDDKLNTMARAYGIVDVNDKQPNAIRKELETLLVTNDKLKKQNSAVKGTSDFLEEMNVTDNVLLRNFIQKAIDDKKLTWSGDGRWKVGQKVVVQVPYSELQRKNDYLCSYLMAGNHADKLQEFIRDFIDKEYLDKVKDKKEWIWLAKIAGVPHEFKKTADVIANTKEFFCPV